MNNKEIFTILLESYIDSAIRTKPKVSPLGFLALFKQLNPDEIENVTETFELIESKLKDRIIMSRTELTLMAIDDLCEHEL